MPIILHSLSLATSTIKMELLSWEIIGNVFLNEMKKMIHGFRFSTRLSCC